MYQYKGIDDTIAAISTPVGHGGIGIVRISGSQSLLIADTIFRSKNDKKTSMCAGFTVHYGNIVDGDRVVDEVLLTLMRSPKSFTTEDVVEISCHGGIVALRTILSLALSEGARLAEPGEFTKRAFLNGRIDLVQAEAVLDIITAKTEEFLKVSTNLLKGELSQELKNIRESLMQIYVELEAFVNFPEDNIGSSVKQNIVKSVVSVKQQIKKLLDTSAQGRILKEGIKIVICGKPNVGKSSLLNVLLKTPRAIVSDIAGTTRDTIEETAQIDGVPFQIVDTAGILDPRDEIEKEAIKRSHMHIDSADMVLLLIDNNSILSKEDRSLIECVKGRNVIVVINKSDLDRVVDLRDVERIFSNDQIVEISLVSREGVDSLQKKMIDSVLHGDSFHAQNVMLSNMRHIESLNKCFDSTDDALRSIENDVSLEFISEDIKGAVNYLDAITGRNVDVDLIDTIFSAFCIGK